MGIFFNGSGTNSGNGYTFTGTSTADLRIASEIGNDVGTTGTPGVNGIGVGAAEPISLEEAKNYVRIRNDRDDELIASLIRVARSHAERYLNSDIVPKQRVVNYDIISEPINLYYAPIVVDSSLSITFEGRIGVLDTDYEVLGTSNPLIRVLSGTVADEVEISYTTEGLSNGDIKSGVLALFAYHYMARGGEKPFMTNWKAFLSPYKTFGYYGVR